MGELCRHRVLVVDDGPTPSEPWGRHSRDSTSFFSGTPWKVHRSVQTLWLQSAGFQILLNSSTFGLQRLHQNFWFNLSVCMVFRLQAKVWGVCPTGPCILCCWVGTVCPETSVLCKIQKNYTFICSFFSFFVCFYNRQEHLFCVSPLHLQI